jgi:integrase
MKRQFKFTKKLLDALPNCPADSTARETEYSDTEVAGLRVLVSKLGRKSFLLRYLSPTQRKRSMKLGDYPAMDITEARQLAINHRSQLSKGIDPQDERNASSESKIPTVKAFVESHVLPHAYATKRSAKDDESRFRCHVLPAFGHLPLNAVTTYAIQQFHNQKKALLCPATANRILDTLRRTFSLANQWGVIDTNPIKGIRFHQENNMRHRYLNKEELARFLTTLSLEVQSPVAADALYFLLATGARKEEALMMRWEHFDAEQATWLIPENKGGRSRHVLLNDAALQLLAKRSPLAGNPFVFPGRELGRPLRNISKSFARILARADIKDLRIHDLRHAYASILVNAGHSLFEVQHLLGHRSVSTTSRYAHLGSDRLRATSNQVANVMQAAMVSVSH